MSVRAASVSDAGALAEIYNHYITSSWVTFEIDPVDAATMSDRLTAGLAAGYPWIVLVVDEELLGYAYAGAWKSRSAYRHTVEATIYLRPDATGNGHGRTLYSALLAALRDADFHTVLAGIALPNEASIRLHEAQGFEPVGQLGQVGYKFDRWIDVGYWQLHLNQ